MNPERFFTYCESLKEGCSNRLWQMERNDDHESFDWDSKSFKKLSGTLMSIQSQYYDNDE